MVKRGRGEVSGKKESRDKVPSKERREQPSDLNLMRGFAGIVDRKGKLQFASEAPVKGLGYTEDDVLRKPFWEASWFAQSSKSQKAVKDSILGALEGETVRCEVEAFTKDGTAMPVTFNVSPLKGKEGDIVSIVAEAEAIVEGKETEYPRESDERLASVFGLMKEAYFEADKRDRVVMINPAGASLLGYKSPVDLVGKRMAEHWASSEERDRFLMVLSKKGGIEEFETSLLKKDGTEVLVEIDAHLLYDVEGEVRGSEGVFRDITNRTIAERKLRESEATSRAVVEQVRDGVLLVKDGEVKFANNAMERLLGYEKDEVNGEQLGTIVTPDWAESVADRYEQWISGELGDEIEKIQFFNKNGDIVEVEIDKVTLQHGGEPSALLIVRDTGGGEEKDLRQKLEMYALVAQNASEGVIVIDKNMEIVFANQAIYGMAGYTAEDLATGIEKHGSAMAFLMPLLHGLPPGGMEMLMERFQKRLKGDAESLLTELSIVRQDGTVMYAELSGSAVQYRGEPADLLLIRDISERRRAEQYLRESEEEFRSIFENMRDMYFRMDGQGNMIMINPAGLEILGYSSADEIVGKSAFESVSNPEEVAGLFMAILEKGHKGETLGTSEISLVQNTTGKSLTIEFLPWVVLDESGQVTAVEGLARDITQRKQREEELARAAMVLETIGDGVVVSDMCGIVLEVNDALLQQTGYERDEIIGKSPSDIFLPEQELKQFFDHLGRLFCGETLEALEYTSIRKDGTEMSASINLSALKDDVGDPYGIVAVIRDITKKKQVEKDLRLSELKYRSLFENMEDVYFSINMNDLSILRINPAGVRLLEYKSEEEMIGMPLMNIFANPEEQMIMIASIMQDVHEGKKIGMVEYTAKLNTGMTMSIEMNPHFVFDVDGQLVEAGGMIRDITERKQAEEKLKESEHSLKRLVEQLRVSQEELSTPVVQIWDSILALPLIGVLDSRRGLRIMEVLLSRIVQTQSEIVILDVTGVSSMDTEVTNTLVKTVQSTSHLGARCAITGVRPDVAQIMSHLGVDMSKFVIKSDMQDGLRWGLDKMGYQLNSGR